MLNWSKMLRTYHCYISCSFVPFDSPSQTHPSTYTGLDCLFSFRFIFHLFLSFCFSARLPAFCFLFVIYPYISCVFCRSFSLRHLLHSLAAIFFDFSLYLSLSPSVALCLYHPNCGRLPVHFLLEFICTTKLQTQTIALLDP